MTAGNITAEIRHLTINNTGGGTFAVAVATNGVEEGKFSLLHVAATATGGDFIEAVYNDGSSPSMNNVTATAFGALQNIAVLNTRESSPSMNNVTASAISDNNNFGVINRQSSSPSIRGSSIRGSSRSVTNSDDSSAKIADSILDGGQVLPGLGLTCVGVYNQNFVALNTSCILPSP